MGRRLERSLHTIGLVQSLFAVSGESDARALEAVLEVADRGPGVPDDGLAQLGNRFYRGVGAIVLFGILGSAIVTLTFLPALTSLTFRAAPPQPRPEKAQSTSRTGPAAAYDDASGSM